VKCPHKEGIWYFVSYCREMQARGVTPCVSCDALDDTVSLMEAVFSADGRGDPE
jgi:hypothetical protein